MGKCRKDWHKFCSFREQSHQHRILRYILAASHRQSRSRVPQHSFQRRDAYAYAYTDRDAYAHAYRDADTDANTD